VGKVTVSDERVKVLRHKFDTMLGGGTVVTEFHCRDVALICDELLELRARVGAEWMPIGESPTEWGDYLVYVLSDKLGGTGVKVKSFTRVGWHCASWERPTCWRHVPDPPTRSATEE
jgi:hypothetical protein